MNGTLSRGYVAALKKEHDQIYLEIDKAKVELLKALREQSGSKRNFEAEVSDAFAPGETFEVSVRRLRDELQKQTDTPFADVKYDIIFDEKVVKALGTKDLKDAIENYIQRYNELLAASVYFKKGTFDYYNASEIAKSLHQNGFFDANHTVNLKSAGGVLEVSTLKDLEDVVAKEKEAIIKDDQLRKKFESVASALNKNAELREFCRYLQENEALLSRMNNPGKFKGDILKSYLRVHYDLYTALIDRYVAADERLKAIREGVVKCNSPTTRTRHEHRYQDAERAAAPRGDHGR